jgi:hypothetical protein
LGVNTNLAEVLTSLNLVIVIKFALPNGVFHDYPLFELRQRAIEYQKAR